MRAAVEDASVGRITIEPSADEPDTLVITLDRAHRPRSIDVAAAAGAADRPRGRRSRRHGPRRGPPAAHPPRRRPRHRRRRPSVGGAGRRPRWTSTRSTPLDGDRVGLTNGLVTVEVDPADGTWSLNGVPGYGRLVDEGDAGDTYNWSPPGVDVIVDRPESVTASVSSSRGPVIGRIDIEARYRVPGSVDQAGTGRRSLDDAVDLPVRTSIELRAGDDVVRVVTEVDNRAQRPPPARPPPAADPGGLVSGRVRVRRRRAGPHRRGRPQRVRAADLPVATVRVRRRPDPRPRGAPRVRAGRHRGQRRRGAGPDARAHAAALHRAHLERPDGPAAGAGRTGDARRRRRRCPAATCSPTPSTSAGGTPTRWPTRCSSRCRSPAAGARTTLPRATEPPAARPCR